MFGQNEAPVTVGKDDNGKKKMLWEVSALRTFNLKAEPNGTGTQQIALLIGGDEPDSEGTGSTDALQTLVLLMSDHDDRVKIEKARFKKITQIEDVLALGDNDRKKTLDDIDETFRNIDMRRKALWDMIGQVGKLADTDTVGQETLRKALTCVSTIDAHLPDAFMGTSGDSLRRRMATLIEVGTPNFDSKTAIENLKAGFSDNGQDITADIGEAYRRVIEPATKKPMEMAKFYFDKAYSGQNMTTVPTDPNDDPIGLSALEATDIIVDQCQKILDYGGKFKDVEDLLKKTGIPPDWWPDKLVAAMQAWRKTDAALQRVKLTDEYEKNNKAQNVGKTKIPITVDDLKGVIDMSAGTFPGLANDILQLIETNPDLVEKLKAGLDKLGGAVGMTSGILEFVKLAGSDDDGVEKTKSGERQEQIDQGLDGISAFSELFNGVLDTIKSAGGLTEDMKSFFETHLLPGVALAKAGIDMVQTGKALMKAYGSKQDATSLKSMAKTEQGRGSREDGGTFANAMGNDQSAMNKLLAKGSVDMFTNVLSATGELAGTVGGAHGSIAKVALKITSTGISLGSKLVFAGINWGEAKRAKAMLDEARKGNPVARVEIFKNSNTYAKMYLVQLVKDGDPLAEQFIIAKGISEENLTKGVSEKLLMQALLNASSQQNDTEDDEQGVNIARHLKTEEYDPNWVFAGPVELTRASYDTAKNEAVAHGLANIATGTGGLLETAEPLLKAADEMVTNNGNTALDVSEQAGLAHRDALLAAIKALRAVNGAIIGATVFTARLDGKGQKDRNGKVQVHKGMSLYLASLLDVSGERLSAYDKSLRATGVFDEDWQPPRQNDPLDARYFTANWLDGVTHVCLPGDGAELAGALGVLKTKWDDFENKLNGNDGKARRAAALAVVEAFKTTAGAIEGCRVDAGAVSAMQDYLMRMLTEGGKQSRAAQDAINPAAWAPTIADPLTADEWTAKFKEAVAEGYASTADKPDSVAEALRGLQQAANRVTTAKDEKGKLAAENSHARAIDALDKAIAPFRATVPKLAEKADALVEAARKTQQGYDTQRKDIPFAKKTGLAEADWETTFNAAVEAGAIPNGRMVEKAAEQLKDALGLVAAAGTKLANFLQLQPRPYDKIRVQAATAKEAIEAAVRAVDLMSGVPGVKNKVMEHYLENDLRKPLEAKLKEQDLADALAGKLSAGFTAPTAFTATGPDLAKNIALAVANGVITKPKRAVGDYVPQLLSDKAKLEQYQTNAQMPQTTRDQYRGFALQAANGLLFWFDKMENDTANDSWIVYMKAARKWALEQRKEISKRAGVELTANTQNQQPQNPQPQQVTN